MSDPLSAEAVAAVDTANQAADVLDLPSQLRDATWRVESAMLEPVDAPGGLVVAGMGGSGIGGALARAALGDQASRPIVVTRSYGLPAWTSPEVTVLLSSYSGDTEETLGCYEAAGALGARRIVVTTGGQLADSARADKVPVIPLPGGLQPRCAVAYMTVAALEVAALSGVGPEMRSEVDVAAALVQKLVDDWGPAAPADAKPKALAADLHETVSVISGSGPTVPVAYRWKSQLNENTKVPAFSGELPEVDHNEIVGWGGNDGLGRFSAIFLDDTDLHPRVRRRIALTRKLVAPHALDHACDRGARGRRRSARVFSLVLLGDLISLYRAVLRGVDPHAPVDVIEQLKSALGVGDAGVGAGGSSIGPVLGLIWLRAAAVFVQLDSDRYSGSGLPLALSRPVRERRVPRDVEVVLQHLADPRLLGRDLELLGQPLLALGGRDAALAGHEVAGLGQVDVQRLAGRRRSAPWPCRACSAPCAGGPAS